MENSKTNIVLSSEELALRNKLTEAASNRQKLYYSDLVAENSPSLMENLSKMLSRISRYERGEDRPFLCAIAVSKNTGYPGVGFYELCHTLNISKALEVLQEECFEYWSRVC